MKSSFARLLKNSPQAWKNLRPLYKTCIYIILGILYALWIYKQRATDIEDPLGRNLLVVLLVNFNIIVISVLAFIVGRHVIRLIFDRRKNILGAKLRSKLMIAFVGLTLVPTVFLFIFASGFINRAVEGWFSNQVETGIKSAVFVARRHYAVLKSELEKLADNLKSKKLDDQDPTLARNEFERFRSDNELFSIKTLENQKKLRLEVHNAAATVETFKEPLLDSVAVTDAINGTQRVLFEDSESSKFIRLYSPWDFGKKQGVLVMTQRIDPELAEAFQVVNESYAEYGKLKLFRYRLKNASLLALGSVTGMILFGAMWVAFTIARYIVGPVESLVEGTQRVSRGEYELKVPGASDDEFGFLIRSFNQMTQDLSTSRKESEKRRLLIEAIINNLAVGVISLDRARMVTIMNAAAARICSVPTTSGVNLDQLLRQDELHLIFPLLSGIEDIGPSEIIGREVAIPAHGRELKVFCTASKIVDERGEWSGVVLLLDDVTELSKAHQMSAWREVARRIAHEIKNPLTPIQLSAQRLGKLAKEGIVDSSVNESVDTIVENVDSIKRLANEFSNFARMPTAVPQPTELNALLSDVVTSFAQSVDDITVQFIAGEKIPEVSIDPEQIRRLIMNLLENAAQAIVESQRDVAGKIEVKSYYDRKQKTVILEISDNGPGIPAKDKSRIFDPYFTTKERGTGLGLAIVTSIISDHHGQMRVYDNVPHGAKFIIELPAVRGSVARGMFSPGRFLED